MCLACVSVCLHTRRNAVCWRVLVAGVELRGRERRRVCILLALIAGVLLLMQCTAKDAAKAGSPVGGYIMREHILKEQAASA